MSAASDKTPRQFAWRSWGEMPGEDLVMMPRELALDLVRTMALTIHSSEASHEDCDAGLHESRFEAHQERMERITNTITAHLCDEGLTPNADLVLRALVMAYEVAPEIPGVNA